MKLRLLLLALPIAFLAACQSPGRNPNAPTPPADPPVKIYDADTGALLNDSTGKNAAGGGRVIANNSSQIPALSPAVRPGSTFAYGKFTYSRVNAVAVAQVKSLEDKYKSAQSSLESLVKGGVAAAGGNYAAAAKEAAALVADAYKAWQDAASSLANSPQPGQGAVDAELLVVGPNAGQTVERVGESVSGTIRSGLAPGAVNTFSSSTKREDITTEAETLAGLKATQDTITSLAQIYAQIDLNRLRFARQSGSPSVDKSVDLEDDNGGGGSAAPAPTTAYDKLSDLEQKFLWKSRYDQAMERGIGTIFVPADRPKIKSAVVTFSNGSKQGPSENYFSPSQKRQRLVFSSPYPAGPAKAEILYADGQTETYDLPDAHKRREYRPGAYKGAAPSPAPGTEGVRAVFGGVHLATILPSGIRPVTAPSRVDFFTKDAAAPEGLAKIGALSPDASGAVWVTPRPVKDGDIFELIYPSGPFVRPFYSNGNLQIWADGTFRVPGSSKPATE